MKQVLRAQAGDAEAFNWLVRSLQDRSVAYATSILGDYQLGQDAAQEAFVEVYRTLPSLRSASAFITWLRKVIFKHCDRMTRGRRIVPVPLAAAVGLASSKTSLEEVAERHDLQQQVDRAIQALPERERVVVSLFYMGQQSHHEIAEFLDIPVTTVKSRLHQARCRLKERMFAMVKDDLQENRPSRDEAFLVRVNEGITKLLASVATAEDIEVVPGDGNPLWDLMVSLLQWAIGVEASDLRLIPARDGMSVEFTRGGFSEQVMVLPKAVQSSLMDRIKMAAELDLSRSDAVQDGLIPIYHNGVNYDALVACRPTEHGERIDIHLIQK